MRISNCEYAPGAISYAYAISYTIKTTYIYIYKENRNEMRKMQQKRKKKQKTYQKLKIKKNIMLKRNLICENICFFYHILICKREEESFFVVLRAKQQLFYLCNKNIYIYLISNCIFTQTRTHTHISIHWAAHLIVIGSAMA